MISDYVKGKKKFDYPPEIQKGIMLHRAIDNYTDQHIATKQAKEIFRPAYRLYSGAVMDVIYDHFLANDENEFSKITLFDFSQSVYSLLDKNTDWMPAPFFRMFPYMKQQNWLYNYHTENGTAKSLGGLVSRAAYLSESETAFHLFKEHYQLLQNCYRHFWADMKIFAKDQFFLLQKNSGSII